MTKKNKLNNIKKANILAENLYLQNKQGYQYIPQNLTNEHITHVLGINLPLNESRFINEELYTRILQEQLIYENFLDTVKNFAKEKINKVVDKINDWKDAAVMIYKVISNPDLLQNFTVNFWKTFQQNTLKSFYAFLEKLGLNNIIPTIQKLIQYITNLKGWQKFLAATGIGAIIKYVTDKLKNVPKDEIMNFIKQYISENGLKDMIAKLTDFRSYIGFLEPIIKGVEFFYELLKPTLDKFKQALQFTTQQSTDTTTT
jgi:hypothetical protein